MRRLPIPRRDELQGEEPPLLSVSPFKPGSAQRLRRSSGKVNTGSSLARVSYQLLLAAPRSCLLEPFGPSPVHVCAKPVRSSSPGFAFTGGQRAACRVCLRLLLAKD